MKTIKPRLYRFSIGAFTLVELLVVMAIIAILVSLIFPSMGGVKEQARTVRCKSNMRQLWVAFRAYSQDNNGRIPDLYWWVKAEGGLTKSYGTNAVLSIVKGTLWPYVQEIGVYGCPSTTIENAIRTYEMPWFLGRKNSTTAGYQGITDEYNNSIFRVAERFTDVARPAMTMMLIDVNNDDNVFASHETGGKWHAGRNQICYVDGHVELATDLDTELAKEGYFHQPDPSKKASDK